MSKQLDQQRDRGWTNLPDDLKRVLMQLFIISCEEPSQQRQRTPASLDQLGHSVCANLSVAGHHALCPLTHLLRP